MGQLEDKIPKSKAIACSKDTKSVEGDRNYRQNIASSHDPANLCRIIFGTLNASSKSMR